MDNQVNSVKQITDRIIRDDILACVSVATEYILSKGHEDDSAPFSWDDVENMSKDFYGMDEYDLDEFLQDEVGLSEADLDELDFSDKADKAESNYYQPDVYEWWLVTGWLASKLQDAGEVVIMGDNIWGRCTSGQAIKMDRIIQQIAKSIQ